MIILILNYIVRSITILMGLVLLFYPFPGFQADPTFVKTMGAVVTAFGIIRLILFIRQVKIKRLLEEME
ncbi:MAG: hypothetical protein HYZ54_12745 [Ignavibacteriae bacterium]|nr:hypothetical protein [Ignavibacteriota bacterium]